jgi:hypothetical protein
MPDRPVGEGGTGSVMLSRPLRTRSMMTFRLTTSFVLTLLALAGAAALSDYQYAQALWLLVTSTTVFGLWYFP